METNKTIILNQVEVNRLSVKLEKSRKKSKQFHDKAKKLEHESSHDHLTGAGNRRHLDRTLSKLWNRKTSQGCPNHLAMLDIDDFKAVNDGFSHELGDRVLQVISKIIKNSIGNNDRLFRYGGEEFIILLINKNIENAITIFEGIRQQIQTYDWYQLHLSLNITATLGMVSNTEEELISKALNAADKRMYKGKRSGKNTLIVDN